MGGGARIVTLIDGLLACLSLIQALGLFLVTAKVKRTQGSKTLKILLVIIDTELTVR